GGHALARFVSAQQTAGAGGGRIIPLAYSSIFNDYLENPRNAGELENANAIGEETNPACGDRLRLSLLIEDGKIKEARFLAYGCPPTLVCGSALTELVRGKTIEEALQ